MRLIHAPLWDFIKASMWTHVESQGASNLKQKNESCVKLVKKWFPRSYHMTTMVQQYWMKWLFHWYVYIFIRGLWSITLTDRQLFVQLAAGHQRKWQVMCVTVPHANCFFMSTRLQYILHADPGCKIKPQCAEVTENSHGWNSYNLNSYMHLLYKSFLVLCFAIFFISNNLFE